LENRAPDNLDVEELIANGAVSIQPPQFEGKFDFAPHLDRIRYYEDGRRVREAIAELWKVQGRNVFVCNGADDAVNHVCATMGRGCVVATFWPAYPYAERFARNAGSHVVRVALAEDGTYPAEIPPETLARRPEIVLLVNPTNPGGRAIAQSTVRRYLDQIPGAIFVVDEAYVDFSPETTLLPLACECDRILIVRSLSKGYGAPGLRLGFVYCAADSIIKTLEDARFFFLTPLTIEGALWLIARGLEETVRLNLEIKRRIVEGIEQIEGLSLRDTDTNFVLVRIADGISAARLQAECERERLWFWWFNETPLFREYFGTSDCHSSLERTFRISPVPESKVECLMYRVEKAVSRAISM